MKINDANLKTHKIGFRLKLALLLLLATTVYKSVAASPSDDEAEKYGTITGEIETSDGLPASFVSVALKGTGYGASTNAKGVFEFKAPAGRYTLVISSVGLEKKELQIEVSVNKVTTISKIILNESAQELKEIVVSATKQEEYKVNQPSPTLRIKTPLLEMAQNIQVITNDVIADQQIFDMLEGVTRNVSGVTRVEHWDNYARINMRGSKIAAFRNGMNVEMPWGPLTEDMSMIERIEFVKGPAGFMLANGEPSGFYNVVTKKPTGISKGEATFTLGSFDTYRTTLDLDGKLSKDGKLLYRLNLMGQLKGSHRDYEFNNRYSIVPVIRYNINDETSLTAEYTYQYSQMSVIGASYVFSPNGYGDLPRNFTTAEPNIDPSEIKDHSLFLTLNHKIDPDWDLTAKLAYFNYKQTGSSLWPAALDSAGNLMRGISIWDAFNESKIGQVFVNGEVNTGAVKHRILMGLDVSYKNYMADWGQSFSLGDTFNIYNPVHGISANELPDFDRSSSLRARAGSNIVGQSYSAIYLQDEIHLWQDLVRLTLAGRFTSVKETKYGANTDDKEITPRVGLSVSLNKNTTAYALYDQAFVPQTGVDFDGNVFDPITGNNVEAGFKKDWFGGSWNSTVAIYQITKNNVLTADPEHLNYSIQLGQTKTKGIELDIRGEIVQNLDLILNYAYTDSEISKDTDESVVGNSTPGTTKHVNNGWLTYHFDNNNLSGIGISLGYQWQVDRSSWYVFDGSEQSLPDYFRMDGSISWQNDKLSLALNINNILDQYLYSGSPYSSYFYWQTEPGINYRFTVGYRF